MSESDLWTIIARGFEPARLHHRETVFTIGNGYLSTREAFEEGFPEDRRATFIHGVFDFAPIVFTELANAPDWLPLVVLLNGERFSLAAGHVKVRQRVRQRTPQPAEGQCYNLRHVPTRDWINNLPGHQP